VDSWPSYISSGSTWDIGKVGGSCWGSGSGLCVELLLGN
jgi:hypothetical protein